MANAFNVHVQMNCHTIAKTVSNFFYTRYRWKTAVKKVKSTSVNEL